MNFTKMLSAFGDLFFVFYVVDTYKYVTLCIHFMSYNLDIVIKLPTQVHMQNLAMAHKADQVRESKEQGLVSTIVQSTLNIVEYNIKSEPYSKSDLQFHIQYIEKSREQRENLTNIHCQSISDVHFEFQWFFQPRIFKISKAMQIAESHYYITLLMLVFFSSNSILQSAYPFIILKILG